MSHHVTFIPAAPDPEAGEDLVYAEQSSGARGLHVLMQDASTRAVGARRQFLLACFRDTVSRYLATNELVGAQTFLRERVIAFDAMARAVDSRVDELDGLGIFVALREPGAVYLLCARGASVRIRWRGVFVPVSTPGVQGVTELPIETARAQHDLFAPTFPETLALYRVEAAHGESAARELLLGGSAEDMAAAVDAVEQLRGHETARVPLSRIRHAVLVLALESPAITDAPATGEPLRMPSLPRVRRTRTVIAVTAGAAVVVAGAVGISSWRSSSRSGTQGAVDHTALKETPAPPPVQKRVVADTSAEVEPAAPEKRRAFALAWQQSFRAAVTSSPVVAGDAVVFGGRDGKIYSIERASGERQWTYAARAGVGASPVFHGGLVVAADYAGNVVALRAGNGGVVWKRALREKIVSTPAVTDERVVAGTVNGRVYAISLESGRVLWKFAARGAIRGAITHAGETFLVPSYDGRLYALDEASGARRWVLPLGGPVGASPASDGEIAVVGSPGGDVVAVDLTTGKKRWSYRAAGAVNSGLTIEDGKVYAGAADRRLYCMDARTGDLLWRFDTEGVILSRPFVGDGTVMITSYDGAVYCLDAGTGRLIDRYETEESIFSSPIMVDGHVFFGNNAGRFYCLEFPKS